jgi:hypothetical protein
MFHDTPNKQVIRLHWDIPILKQLSSSSFPPPKLTYFGMPGAEIKDILDWKDLLSRQTAVQIVRSGARQQEEDLSVITKMINNAGLNDIQGFQVLRGSVEDIILYGRDINLFTPRESHRDPSGKLCFTYDIVNLDFVGGAGYKARGSQKRTSISSGGQRIEAVRKLIDRQRGHSFVLFLTVNVRDTLGEEPLQYLKECAQRFQTAEVQRIVKWTVDQNAGGMKHYQLKTWIPLFVKDVAEGHLFRCHCYPPVVYEGHEHARMVHFSFLLEYDQDRILRVSSPQDEQRVVQLPMIEALDGKLVLSEIQYQDFDSSICDTELSFLDEETREDILATLGSKVGI